jgi:hypothetical protein
MDFGGGEKGKDGEKKSGEDEEDEDQDDADDQDDAEENDQEDEEGLYICENCGEKWRDGHNNGETCQQCEKSFCEECRDSAMAMGEHDTCCWACIHEGLSSKEELAAKDTEIASLKSQISRLEGELRDAQAAPAGAGVGNAKSSEKNTDQKKQKIS